MRRAILEFTLQGAPATYFVENNNFRRYVEVMLEMFEHHNNRKARDAEASPRPAPPPHLLTSIGASLNVGAAALEVGAELKAEAEQLTRRRDAAPLMPPAALDADKDNQTASS